MTLATIVINRYPCAGVGRRMHAFNWQGDQPKIGEVVIIVSQTEPCAFIMGFGMRKPCYTVIYRGALCRMCGNGLRAVEE